MRWENKNICAECKECNTRTKCKPIRKKLRDYTTGIRFTSDGFDCALPVAIDSHSHCSYGCLYCFSDNLIQSRVKTGVDIGQMPLGIIERIFSGEPGKKYEQIRKALKYDNKKNGYPAPVQLGAICDPCDNIERNQGWLLKLMDIAIKYNQPIRMSTKGRIFQVPEYLKKISEAPQLFWVAFSIISPDDEMMAKIDRYAPTPTERLKTMKLLSNAGVKTSLRFRPIFPGISDSTKNHPKAYKELIEKAKESGAIAISYECGFTPGGVTQEIKKRWDRFGEICGVDYLNVYKNFGKSNSCTRPSYTWTENIMHAIAEEAKKNQLTIGVSDPVWKQLTETGCCCGILPDDEVFGNWERENATNMLMRSKNEDIEIKADDIIPPWAYKVKHSSMCSPGVGPKVVYSCNHATWADKLRQVWNTLEGQRSPLNYFQGALLPIRKEGNEIIYKYKGLKRHNKKVIPYWKI